MRARLGGLAALGVLVGGCGGSTGPHNGGGGSGPISFVGAGQTDSVETVLPQALVVTVRGPNGQSSAGHIVQFVSVLDSAGTSYEAYVQPLTSALVSTFVSDSLDANGHASVVITLGIKAGTATVLVKVPDFGYLDSAKFTVTAGHTRGIVLTPADTTVIEGHSVTLHAGTVDQFGNPTSGPVQLAASGPATIAGQTVTTTGIGVVTVVATSGALATDTAHVSSVPTGQLAASVGNGIVIANFDGTGMRRLAPTTVGNLKWAPSGQSIVFDQSLYGCGANGDDLQSTDLQGNVTVVTASGDGLQYPTYSRDGTWIYYTLNNGSAAQLWRVHPDGTNADSLNSQNPAFDLYSSPSPDGTQLVYSTIFSYGVADLRVLTISTGAVTDLGINGWAPSWAPSGNHIAYLQGYQCQSPVSIANADGSGVRALTTDAYQGELDWSPDGQWIVGYNVSRNRIDLVNATTGVSIPLTFTSGMSSPSWLASPPASMARVRASR